MTDEHLKSLIDKLNKNKTGGLIHLRPLSATVDFAKVWIQKPKPTDNISAVEPRRLYFVKNSDGLYVASVLDMGTDLHWFVAQKHRRKGYLTKAMKETILFHLFQDREEQKITIDKKQIGEHNFKASENVALSLGFVKTDKDDYILASSKYQAETYIYGHNTHLAEERLGELRRQITYIGHLLWLIQAEVEMKLGYTDYSEELNGLVGEVMKHRWKIDDAWWESKTNTI